jgi:uncharacterized membrane protein
MADFLTEFFVNPILINGWFNPVNTLLWGFILVASAYLVYAKILRKIEVPIDRRFAISILPFIFWASSTRVLRDLVYGLAYESSGGSSRFLSDIAYQTGVIQQQAFSYISGFMPIPPLAGFFSWIVAFFPTPGSYIFTFLFALGALLLSLGIQRYWKGGKVSYWKPMFLIGLIACAMNLLMLPLRNPWGLGMILGITGAFTAIFFGIAYLHERKILKWKPLGIFSRVNSTLLSSHILDSSATFVSVAFFGYYEQHPVPRLFIEAIGPWTFFILKLAVLLPSLYIIDKYAEKGDFQNFLKIVILILGLAPGLRDAIRLGAGV